MGVGKIALLLVAFVSGSVDVQAHDAERLEHQHADGQRDRTLVAVRANPHAPVIDGVLDDPVWSKVPPETGLTQTDPESGEPATEQTLIRVVYDDEAIYFGIDCLDGAPDSVVAALTRRDGWLETDRVTVNLDPHHDHLGGYYFETNPSGWKGDGVLYGDTNRDRTWDGVWEVKSSRHEKGWSTEFRIPYRILRFNAADEYVWGVQVARKISRRKEFDRLVYWEKGLEGWASRFGHLRGIAGIEPGRAFDLLPFTVGRGTFEPASDDGTGGRDLFGTAGVDLRYGLTPAISLNATFNPDFGQVEGDPAVLNLGVFENFFSERRPFFKEGSAVFEQSGPGIVAIDGPARLFHSRRIGRRPNRFDKPDGTDYVSRPDGTTILGAAKVTGKTRTGLAFGLIDAVTDEEYALIEQEIEDPNTGETRNVQSQHKLVPYTNYLVGRVKQDVREGSHIGAFGSAVSGSGFDPAFVGSVDGELNLKQRTYKVSSRWAGSRTSDSDGVEKRGWEGSLLLETNRKTWGGAQVYADTRSEDFDTNDLGFMNRANRSQLGAWVRLRRREPYKLARSSSLNINAWQHWSRDGVVLRKGYNINSWHDLHNYWGLGGGIGKEFSTFDDLVTRGGPVMVDPPNWNAFYEVWTDSRKPAELWFWGNMRWDDYGETSRQSHGVWLEVRPMPQLRLVLEPRSVWNTDVDQWIENVDDDGDDEDDHFVFGRLRSRIWEVSTRATYSFTPDMSLEFWVQQFVTQGNYDDIKELARPESFEFRPYTGLDENPDFSRRSVRSNLVFRWEYRPGSTLFVVWQQSRDREREFSLGGPSPEFRPWGDMWGGLGDEGDNIFLVKVNYWMGL